MKSSASLTRRCGFAILFVMPFGVLWLEEQTVVGILRSAGFTIVQTFADHLVVDAQAPSSVVEQFFATQLHNVFQGAYGTHYAPSTAFVVPASLAHYVAGVTLDTLVSAQP